MKPITIKSLQEQIAHLKKINATQERAIKVLTEQRNETYIEQANKLVMFKVNSLLPQSGTP